MAHVTSATAPPRSAPDAGGAGAARSASSDSDGRPLPPLPNAAAVSGDAGGDAIRGHIDSWPRWRRVAGACL
jgi:hypothetical protein